MMNTNSVSICQWYFFIFLFINYFFLFSALVLQVIIVLILVFVHENIIADDFAPRPSGIQLFQNFLLCIYSPKVICSAVFILTR